MRFCGLLTHSGSRGVGYGIANHFMRLAAQETARHAKVPCNYDWLDLDSEAGALYWQLMELAGAFAKANHDVIYTAFARRSGLTPVDESPMSYKNVERVMELQIDAGLVAPIARMRPVTVIMAGEAGED